jgi:hypothetical protein
MRRCFAGNRPVFKKNSRNCLPKGPRCFAVDFSALIFSKPALDRADARTSVSFWNLKAEKSIKYLNLISPNPN